MRFRTANANEAAALAALVNSAYRGKGSRRGWTTEEHLLGGQRTDEEKILEMIVEPDSRVEVIEDDGTLAACIRLKKEDDGSCYIGTLSVDPARQARGLGRRLIEHSEAIARKWGCRRMRMTVIHLRPELIAYYERRGYAATGASEPFPTHDPRFGLPKVEGLRLLELAKAL
jgi:GNAT superfamily N-acetyltransferase